MCNDIQIYQNVQCAFFGHPVQKLISQMGNTLEVILTFVQGQKGKKNTIWGDMTSFQIAGIWISLESLIVFYWTTKIYFVH